MGHSRNCLGSQPLRILLFVSDLEVSRSTWSGFLWYSHRTCRPPDVDNIVSKHFLFTEAIESKLTLLLGFLLNG